MALGLAHSKLRNQVTTMGDFHARTDQGLAFTVGLSDLTLASGKTISVLLRTKISQKIYMIPKFVTGGESKLEIFEDPIVTVDGSVLIPSNYNRSSDYSVESIFTHSPAIAKAGTLLNVEIGISGAGIGSNYWIFGPSKLYEFRLTNLSNQTNIARLYFDFYEIGIPGLAEDDGKYVVDDYVVIDYVEVI